MSCESDESGIRLGGNTSHGMFREASSERRSDEFQKQKSAQCDEYADIGAYGVRPLTARTLKAQDTLISSVDFTKAIQQ